MFNRKQQNRKWQDRPQLYRGRFFFLRQLGQVALVVGLIVLVVSTLLYFRNSQALSIKHVAILGELKHLSHDDVVVLSGLSSSDKLFAVNLSRVRDNILKYQWVEDVRIRREFPDTIQINVTEREPLALLVADANYLVDESGHIFKIWETSDQSDLPVITGFDAEEMKLYPLLMRQRLNDTVAFLIFLNGQDFYHTDPVSEVNVDAVYGFTVFTLNGGLEIFYGKGSEASKQAKLEKFKLSKFYTEQRVIRLDVSMGDKVIARQASLKGN